MYCVCFVYMYVCRKTLLTLNDIDENKNMKLHDDEFHAKILLPIEYNIQKTMTLVKRPCV